MIIFPYDEPIYVGTLGINGVDSYLENNPWPFNAIADGIGGHPDATVGVGPEYPVPFLHGTNAAIGGGNLFSPVFFIAYSQTFRVEIHGRPTGLVPGDSVFKIPDIIAPRTFQVPIHGTNADFKNNWRGYIDRDGTVYYMKGF